MKLSWDQIERLRENAREISENSFYSMDMRIKRGLVIVRDMRT
jgi:hypothetical protein